MKLWFLTLLCGEKSLWQSFKSKKSDFLSQGNVKNHDFIKKSVQFSIFLEHPLVYIIESNKCKARDWTNKKRPMHFGASLSSGEVLEWKRFMTNP